MLTLADAMDESAITDWAFPGRGLIRGEALAKFVREHTGGKAIEQMALPLGIVATDLDSGAPILFQRGDAGIAVRASRYSMTEITDNRSWQFLSRSSTPTGYPTRWHRYGNRIYINPTPSASYTTKALMVGFAREATLSADADVFIMDPLWHPAVIDYAVHLGADELGWTETAQAALMACDRKLEEAVTILGRENASDLDPVGKVVNDPTGR